VNIGDERDFRYALADLFQRNGGIVVRHRQTHDLTTGAHHFFDLRDRSTDVGGVRLRHRLNRDGRTTADLNVFNLNWTRLTHYFEGADAAGARGCSELPQKVLIKSLLITKTINNKTITKPTC